MRKEIKTPAFSYGTFIPEHCIYCPDKKVMLLDEVVKTYILGDALRETTLRAKKLQNRIVPKGKKDSMRNERNELLSTLPWYVPAVDIQEDVDPDELTQHCGLATYQMKPMEKWDFSAILDRISKMPYVKLLFSNCVNELIVLVFMGTDVSIKGWKRRYLDVAHYLYSQFPDVKFIPDPKITRAITLSYDPRAVYRRDSELKSVMDFMD